MARGSKDAYTDKQKRQAQHIEEGYKKRGISDETAEARAWATVNKETGGGKKSGSGRGKPVKRTAAAAGGRKTAAKKAARKRSTAKSTSGATRSPRKRAARKTS